MLHRLLIVMRWNAPSTLVVIQWNDRQFVTAQRNFKEFGKNVAKFWKFFQEFSWLHRRSTKISWFFKIFRGQLPEMVVNSLFLLVTGHSLSMSHVFFDGDDYSCHYTMTQMKFRWHFRHFDAWSLEGWNSNTPFHEEKLHSHASFLWHRSSKSKTKCNIFDFQ